MNSSGTNAVKTTAERSNLRNLVQIGTAAVIVLICVEQLRKVLRPILK